MGTHAIGKAVASRIFLGELRKPRIDLDQAYREPRNSRCERNSRSADTGPQFKDALPSRGTHGTGEQNRIVPKTMPTPRLQQP
jgi:hypothetical protein